MKIQKTLKFNALFYCYIFLQLLVVIFGAMEDKVIGNSINITYASIIHITTLLFFSLGYLPISKRFYTNYKSIKKKQIILSNKFVFYSLFFTITGLITSVATIGEVMSPTEYLSKIFAGGSNQELIEAKVEAGEAGLSGILKMLNYLPLGVFLIVNGIKVFYNQSVRDSSRLNFVIYFSLAVCFIKMLFSLDRLTLLAILFVFIYRYFLDKKVNTKAIVMIVFIFFVLGFITSLRMEDTTILDFIVVYFKLSITNFQLVLDNQNEWSYGFNTFLMPLAYVFKFFGIDDFSVVGPKTFIWNHAQYFTSSFYIDFGYFFLIGFFFMGVLIRKIQVKSILGKPYFPQIYFIVLFALASFVSVPIIRGVEFWVMLVLAFIYNKLFKVL